jgi:amidohydrolase
MRGSVSSPDITMPVINSIAAHQEEMTAWRRDIHAHPEIAFEEVRTSALVAEKLASWGIEVHRGLAKTGVVGVLRGRNDSGRTIGLRADMDALPMNEANTFAYRSTREGAFHGCGHDGHTTMLLGAARYLAETRNFDGTVHFIFQPAEEGGGGGRVMVEEGLLDRFPCDELYALHNWPLMPFGTIGVRSGPMMAATDTFDVTIRARGGHAAIPHKANDPVVVAAHLITALQTLVSRSVNPLDSAVLSVTRVQTGSAYNVIPDDATLWGTVRTFRPELRDQMEEGMGRICAGIAAAFGCEVALDYHRGYPPTVNHEEQAGFAAEVAAEIVGPQNVERDVEPSMGGEDFSYMLEKRPGAYLFIGQGGGRHSCMVHNPHYDFNDALLPVGASLLSRLVEKRLPLP